jgi:ribonuclease-3
MNFLRRLAGIFGGRPSTTETSVRVSGELQEVDFKRLELLIHYTIRNGSLFSQALAHRSYTQEHEAANVVSYERLEFLGDSILNFVVGEYLYHLHANAEEGDLTKVRSRLVNRTALSILAKQIHLEDFLLLSSNASKMNGRGLDKILSDCFEALVAAIYLDSGFPEAREFVRAQVIEGLRSGELSITDDNFKSKLLEFSQSGGLGVPRYTTIKEEGPDHDRTFTIEVYLGSEPFGVGIGKNKKDAEQAAAEKALAKLQID